MNAHPWPCSQCHEPGVVNLAALGYCAVHLGELLSKFDPSSFGMQGRWIQDAVLRPDHGPGWAECRCPACDATAVAQIGSPCGYCDLALERLTAWHVAKLLRAPDIDLDDPRCDAVFRAWADRLDMAIEAGLITEAMARRALDRGMRHAAA